MFLFKSTPIIFIFCFLQTISLFGNSYIIKIKPEEKAKTILSIRQTGAEVNSIIDDNKYLLNRKTDRLLSPSQNAALENLTCYYIVSGNDESFGNKLKEIPTILSVTPNYIYRIEQPKQTQAPNDPFYKFQWALAQVKAETAWQKATGKNIIVGVVDTGIDYDHPELKNQLWINEKEDINNNGRFDNWSSDEVVDGVSGDLNGIDDDGNGYIDDIIGFDFVDQSVANIGDYTYPDHDPYDEGDHGTLVSGVIAAKSNNDTGIAGLAFDSRIMSLRALDATGNGETDDIAAAIVYAAVNGAQVLNFSFGEQYSSPLLHDAVKFAYSMGCVMAASSGNNNWFLQHYPSDYPEVICVGGSKKDGGKYDAGNYGSHLDISAPGQEIITTQAGNKYKTTDGTSLASPYVTAAAALLLELDKSLSPESVKGILLSSASEAGETGWDTQFGAGLLNAGSAVNSLNPSEISIYYPLNDITINKDKTSGFHVLGTVTTPLFDNYRLFIGEGLLPKEWTPVSDVKFKQIKKDTLAFVQTSELKDTVYTLRVLVNLKNGGSLEKRLYFNIISKSKPLEITLLRQTYPYYEGKKVCIVSAVTTIPALFSVRYKKEIGDEFVTVSEYDDFSAYHSVIISENAPRDLELFAEAIAISESGDTASVRFTINIPNETFPTDKFKRKDYSLPVTYIFNQVNDLYCTGKPSFAANELDNLSFAKTYIYEFTSGSFTRRDTSEYGWLPVGFGDSNGDGLTEFFGMGNYESILMQPKTNCGKMLDETVFKSPVTDSFWGESMFDFSGDGKPDLVFYNDTSVFVYSFETGAYQLLARAELPVEFKSYGVVKGTAAGDFDDDGKPELLMTAGKGQVFIYEYDGGAFTLEFADSAKKSDRNQYVCTVDVEGDGQKEILIGNYGSRQLFDENELNKNIWTFGLLKATDINKYEYVWTDHFHGVRAGVIRRLNISYKNGVAAGNIDGIAGDEIVISTFPNLYVMKWNSSKSSFEPMWIYPSSLANAAVIHDFDGNGAAEIGFATFSNTSFFEYTGNSSKPSAPTGFDGWALNDSAGYFFWNKSNDAAEYEIYMIERSDNGTFAIPLVRTSNLSITVDTLQNNTHYEITIRSINLSGEFSDFSDIVDIFTHKPIAAHTAETINSKTVKVLFSGSLPMDNIEPANFEIYSDDNFITFPSTVLTSNDTIAILSFQSNLPDGNYTLKIKSFPDYYRTPTVKSELDFEITPDFPVNELYLKSLRLLSKYLIRLDFSEPVDIPTGADYSNYTLSPFGSFISAEPFPDSAFVMLTLNPAFQAPARGKNYILKVNNVKAKSGNPMTKGPGSSLGFVYSAPDNESSYIYPNPIRLADNPEIIIANLTAQAEVNIMTLEGDLLITLHEKDGNGGVEWDGKDRNGNFLKPGVYLYKVSGKNLQGEDVFEELHKFMVTP